MSFTIVPLVSRALTLGGEASIAPWSFQILPFGPFISVILVDEVVDYFFLRIL
jgi:hypothetical protein